jgi:superfamily II DNA/RNA helicase
MSNSFAQLGLPEALVGSLASRGFEEPFPIQTATIPDALSGRDVCGKAPTGSGKTLAFGLPILAMAKRGERRRPTVLILAPTRELAEQIKQELSPFAAVMSRSITAIYGGVGYGPQKKAFSRGVDIVVATPGRLEDLMEQGVVDLSRVAHAVIDEADRMGDMGFLPAVRRILDQTSPDRQTVLFSATLDGEIDALTRRYQRSPVRHEAGTTGADATVDARHLFWLVDHQDRVEHAARAVETAGRSIIFTRTRHGADRLARQLKKLGIGAEALHGGRSQNQRTKSLSAFSAGRASALVATDVAARGIHVDDVAAVVHFDPPADAKDYLHRSGRTARAGATGTVITFVTGQHRRAVQRIQQDLGIRVDIEPPRHDGVMRADAPVADRVPGNGGRSKSKSSNGGPAGKSGDSIYVANLPWSTTESDVRSLFGRYGKVHQATIITDRRSGRSRGFGFVDMPGDAAREAIDALHGADFNGRDLTVRVAKPRR